MISLLKSVLLCYLPAFSGVMFKPGAWYSSLNKPLLNPPGWVFGPVWTFLYLTMGVSLWLIRQQPEDENQKKGLKWFYLQLFLNATWTPLFFGAHRMAVAAIVLFSLIVAILCCIYFFFKTRKIAAVMLIPYLLWCCFAFYLNSAYFYLNRQYF